MMAKKPTTLKKKKPAAKPKVVKATHHVDNSPPPQYIPEIPDRPERIETVESDIGPTSSMGRPRVKINLDSLESLMRLNPSLEDTADFFKCSQDTIERVIRKNFDCTFAEFRRKNQVDTRLAAKRKLISMWDRQDNLGALIWYMKNELGWADKVEATQNITIKPEVTYEARWGGNTEPSDGLKIEDTEKDDDVST